ncbi:MAG: hypothetical protein IKV41_04780 [Oscillospiraceae bacterium]|nr:hypothetical protein [Oscillospiraceae bacterium]
MKKKILAILMAAAMTFSFAACGGGDAPAEETSAPAAEEVVEEAAPAEEEIDITNWTAFQGVMADGETTLFYVFNEDSTAGGLVIVSADATKSISVFGENGIDEELGYEYIADADKGLTMYYTHQENEDGTIEISFADGDSATIVLSDTQEVLDAMDVIAEGTEDVTEQYIASLYEAQGLEVPAAEEAVPAEETAVDLTGWSCYQGVMPDGETTVFFAVDETATRGAMFMLSADCTQSISVIGNYVYDEAAGIESLTDDESGLQINFTTTDNGDGTLTVDMGDGDVATIVEAEPQVVIDAMDVIAAETTDVTAEYIAGLQ